MPTLGNAEWPLLAAWGKTPTGAAYPNFKVGRYSAGMPQRLQARYEAALSDETLLDLRSEIAVVDVRLSQLAERIEPGITPDWFDTIDRIRALIPRLQEGDQTALEALEQLVSVPGNDHAAWDALFTLIDTRRRLVVSESRRIREMQSTLTVEEAVNLSTALANLALKYIPEDQRASYVEDVAHVFQVHHSMP